MTMLRKTIALMLFVSGSTSLQAFTLQEAVDQTIKTNPQLLTQVNRRLAAAPEVDIAKSGYYPKLDLNAGVGYERTDNSSTSPEDVEYRREEIELTFRQMLFDGYATKSAVDRAESQVMAAANRVASDSESTGLNAVSVYLGVLFNSELFELAKVNLQAHQDTFERIKKRADSGFDTKVDLEQAAGRLALAKANLTSTEGNLLDARAAFLRVVGVPAEDLQFPEGDCCSVYMPGSLNEAIEQACSKHPELLSAIAFYESSLAEHQSSKALHRPNLYLDMGASWNENLDGVEGGNDDKYAMLRGEYNVYRGGSDDARVLEAAHASEAAKDNVRTVKRDLDQAVRTTWNALLISEKTLPFLEQRAVSAERSRDSYYEQFVIGQRTLLDLLDSENELFTARSQLLDGRYARVLAQYQVMAALGVLLDSLEIQGREEASVVLK
ncbi:MAG: TolC family outer membrane protein [Neptuniibacter sp.]